MWRALLVAFAITACTNDYGAFRYPRTRDAGVDDAHVADAADAGDAGLRGD